MRATTSRRARRILELFATWDHLAERRALPDQLQVLELGVGNGNQARVWLDEFLRVDRELGRDYYRRLHYLMGDYSPRLLDVARRQRRDPTPSTSARSCSTRSRPRTTLGFLKYKAFFVYISNVYDNLPTDEIARIDGHLYQVESRAYLQCRGRGDVGGVDLGARPKNSRTRAPAVAARARACSPRRAPHRFADAASRRCASGTWCGSHVRLEERYVAGAPAR